MTRRAILSFVVTAALLTTYAAGPASLAAEPISQSDVAPPTTPTTQQMPEITDAVGKFRHRDFEGALKMFREAAKKNPDLPPPYLLITQLFLQSNMLPAARNSLERAVMESPDDPQPYIFMGEIALRERRITEARLLYEKANSVLANYSAAAKRKTFLQSQIYNGLALTDEARENWADAKKELEEWLKIDSKNTMALQQLAQCQFQLKNVQGALDRLNEAVKIDSKILTPEATIAQFYAQAGDKENARKWIIAALTKAPMDIETRLVAAQWAWETEQFDEAKRQAKAALQLDAKSLKAMLLCGLVALFQKDYPTAELYFESAHRKSPKDFAASNNLALALAEQKDEAKRQQALEYAEVNVRQYPKVADAYSTYGWILYKLNRLEEAENAMRQAISGNFTPETAYYMACILAARGGRDADVRQFLEGALGAKSALAQKAEAKAMLDKLDKEKAEKEKAGKENPGKENPAKK